MADISVIRRLASRLPQSLKRPLRRLVSGTGNPYIAGVRHAAAVSDIYFWIADGDIDTMLPLENYFSRFFPDLDTATEATVEILSPDGQLLGQRTQPIGHMAMPALRVSELLKSFGQGPATPKFGNLIWQISIPGPVRDRMKEIGDDMLFWDRGYIGYMAGSRQISFVHGVDKARIMHADGAMEPWPVNAGDRFTATPELPVEFKEYIALEIIVQNRDSGTRPITLTATDRRGGTAGWSADIAAMGVHRFRIDPGAVAALDRSAPLGLRIDGLPTRYGRPIALKWFDDGMFSLMHC